VYVGKGFLFLAAGVAVAAFSAATSATLDAVSLNVFLFLSNIIFKTAENIKIDINTINKINIILLILS